MAVKILCKFFVMFIKGHPKYKFVHMIPALTAVSIATPTATKKGRYPSKRTLIRTGIVWKVIYKLRNQRKRPTSRLLRGKPFADGDKFLLIGVDSYYIRPKCSYPSVRTIGDPWGQTGIKIIKSLNCCYQFFAA